MKLSRRTIFSACISLVATLPFVGKNLAATPSRKDIDSIFAAVIDTFIPADDFAGAIDVGVDVQLLEQIRASRSYLKTMSRILDALDKTTKERLGSSFSSATLNQRTRLLSEILAGKMLDSNARMQLSHIRHNALTLFYTSPQAFDMLDYHPPSQGGYPDYDRPFEKGPRE